MTKRELATLTFRNSHILWLSVLVIVVAGLGSWWVLPRAEDPRILNRFATVLTPYPGASASKVEALVTEPIEQNLRREPEIKHVYSQSLPGFSIINIELKDTVTEVETVWSRLRDYVDDTNLPHGAGPADLDDTRSYPYTRILAFKMNKVSVAQLLLTGRYAKELASRLRVVKGTDKVALFGEPIEQVLVKVDPQALANLGLTMTSLAQRIRNADAKVAAGTLNNQHHRMVVEVTGGFDVLSRLRELSILSNNGAQVHLQDIADVNYAIDNGESSISLVDNQRVILIAVRMQDKLSINDWNESIQRVINAFKKELPASIQIESLFNQLNYTQQRFEQLHSNIFIGLLSIVIVLFVTLGWRASVIVGLVLPLTMLLTLFSIRVIGLSLNQMTVIGLIVALGVMIDNAIVIAEGIQQRLLAGMEKIKAVADTVRHFWLPLLGATLTTILAFIPIILLPGATGEFVGGIGYSVIFTLLGSYVISHTIIASLAGKYLSNHSNSHWWSIGVRLPRLAQWFNRWMLWCLQHARLSALVLFAIASIGFIARFGLTEQFFPVSGRNQLKMSFYTSPSNDIVRTKQLIMAMQKEVAREPQVKQQVWSIGRSIAPFYYNIIQTEEKNPTYAQVMITLHHVKNLDQLVQRIQSKLDKKFPQALLLVERIDQGPPFDAPIEIRIYGQDLHQLNYLGDQVRLRLAKIPQLTHSQSGLNAGIPKLTIKLDEKQVHDLGLSSQQLARQLKNFIDGIKAGELLEGSELIPIKVNLKEIDKAQLSRLLELPLSIVVAKQRYNAVPLSAVAKFQFLPDWRGISRRDNSRVNTIYGYLQAGVLPADGLKAWQQQLKQEPIKIPPGYSIEIGGEKEKRDESVGNLLVNIPLVLLLLLSVLVLTFRSLKYVAILLLIIMLAVSMGLLCLFLSGYPFGFQVIIALIGLVGLAINAAIVILSEIRSDKKANEGDIIAIAHSVSLCLRHIFSTTLTTMAGFMPLILSGGKFWPPFAYVLAGGTFFTTLISIIWVPVLYAAFTCKCSKDAVEKAV